MIDLHSHTTFSDGEHAPEDLLAMAKARGVTRLAVTDHDTVAGLERCAAAAAKEGVELVPGIEISAHLVRREVHVLGHFVDPAFPELRTLGASLGDQRRERMKAMVERMVSLGVAVTFADVERVAAGASIGRPHLARALVEAGHCNSTQEAFTRWLGDGRPGHVPSFRITAEEAIALIHRSGGTATLAHPGPSRIERPDLDALSAAGLDGLEVFHSDHVPSQRDKLLRWAADLDLAPTAGSDYHGPKVSPGRGLGDESMSVEQLEALRARRGARTL